MARTQKFVDKRRTTLSVLHCRVYRPAVLQYFCGSYSFTGEFSFKSYKLIRGPLHCEAVNTAVLVTPVARRHVCSARPPPALEPPTKIFSPYSTFLYIFLKHRCLVWFGTVKKSTFSAVLRLYFWSHSKTSLDATAQTWTDHCNPRQCRCR